MLNVLTVNVTALNGRDRTFQVILAQGLFKMGDTIIGGNPILDPNGITKWYPVVYALRSNLPITLPAGVQLYTSDGGTQQYQILRGSFSPLKEPREVETVVKEAGYKDMILRGTQEPL